MFGLGFWLQGVFAVKSLGVVSALWVYYLTAVVILFAIFVAARRLVAPPRAIVPVVGSTSIFSLIGFSSLAYGATTGHVAVVTVLSSLASGVTALLGFFVRGERPSALQWTGIAAIIIGVVVLKLTPQMLGGEGLGSQETTFSRPIPTMFPTSNATENALPSAQGAAGDTRATLSPAIFPPETG